MKTSRLIAGAAIVVATATSPAMARDYCDAHRCYHHYSGGPVGTAAGAAAGIAGAAIGTAGAIATAPFRNSYAYDRPYYRPNDFACRPGTWFRGPDGRRHPCQ
ncbi:hypothetical protein MTX25_35030 [Bradyrhizobium sp. ISRA432]|nr:MULTISPECIES: hypothetical protein [unclassified Bradyrhizobium]WGR70549.1 hypothetical protein MTX24_35345 [Bradyrhizobium sp. ISRA426]WGR75386.1 hypothetical protein MTX21_20445 [Bradyrhizobium sp. ISRA430]WGR85790.1 hypothetical protein MTX25_35030 [Bradyrhizobium sp. ISRA432]